LRNSLSASAIIGDHIERKENPTAEDILNAFIKDRRAYQSQLERKYHQQLDATYRKCIASSLVASYSSLQHFLLWRKFITLLADRASTAMATDTMYPTAMMSRTKALTSSLQDSSIVQNYSETSDLLLDSFTPPVLAISLLENALTIETPRNSTITTEVAPEEIWNFVFSFIREWMRTFSLENHKQIVKKLLLVIQSTTKHLNTKQDSRKLLQGIEILKEYFHPRSLLLPQYLIVSEAKSLLLNTEGHDSIGADQELHWILSALLTPISYRRFKLSGLMIPYGLSVRLNLLSWLNC